MQILSHISLKILTNLWISRAFEISSRIYEFFIHLQMKCAMEYQMWTSENLLTDGMNAKFKSYKSMWTNEIADATNEIDVSYPLSSKIQSINIEFFSSIYFRNRLIHLFPNSFMLCVRVYKRLSSQTIWQSASVK